MTSTTPPHIIDALEQLDGPQRFESDETLSAHSLEGDNEAPARRQRGQLVELFVEGCEPFQVRVTNRERIAYEKTAARHRDWPPMRGGENFAMTFVCWSAARRAGHPSGSVTFEQWCELLEDYEVVQEEAADPTR